MKRGQNPVALFVAASHVVPARVLENPEIENRPGELGVGNQILPARCVRQEEHAEGGEYGEECLKRNGESLIV